MQITLKNYELVPAIEFLHNMELAASASRPVTKLLKLLNKALEGVQESQMSLIEEYGQRDEKGELSLAENGTDYLIDPSKNEEYQTCAKNLLSEEVVIEGGIFAKVIEKLPEILQEYDAKISGKDALIYDRLLDEFEKDEKQV